jgi:hypothetical protein
LNAETWSSVCVIGAMASVINHALAAIDELAASHDEPFRGDDLLKAMAISLQQPGDG